MKLLASLFALLATTAFAEDRSITLSSTTSTQNSGLYDYLLPQFTQDTGIAVKVVAVGTGQAIRIAKNGDADISRGDDSGTHKKELQLWSETLNTTPSGSWYREIGSGMGAALNMAAAVNGYTLSDRGTWLSFGNKADLEIKWSGDQILLNPYGLILVNPEKYPHTNSQDAATFADWMTSPKGQNVIGSFRIQGKQLFCPDSEKSQKDKIEACPAQ